ncbi:MAG: hypothetical protein NZ927_09945, partial [Candidatus Calescibacterium sp.]|nr:hypothetical protein [Candidatus Calescibacterium sp.]
MKKKEGGRKMPKKRDFKDYLLPIVGEEKYKGFAYYTFKTITWEGEEEYREGYVEPSLEELPQLELTDFLDYGFLIITPEFVKLEVIPRRMLIYLKPFEVIEFINGIREIFSKAEYNPRVVRKDFEIKLPEIYMYVGTVNSTFWYYRPGKVIICNYDIPITDDFITWVFKEVEREFLLF